ncbi:hypothetical protein TCAL_09953, partial [Tigriopus californicus]
QQVRQTANHPFPSGTDNTSIFCLIGCCSRSSPDPFGQCQFTPHDVPFGEWRFHYNRAPMGLNASSDKRCHRSDVAIKGLPGVLKLVDDILVQAPTPDIFELAIPISVGFIDYRNSHKNSLKNIPSIRFPNAKSH